MPGALLGGVLIGLTEALAGLFFTPSAKSMFSFGLLVLVLVAAAARLAGAEGVMQLVFAGASGPSLGAAGDPARGSVRGPLARQRLSAHCADHDPVFRLCRPGLERDDGLCRPAFARARDLCRSWRLYAAAVLYVRFRDCAMDRHACRDRDRGRMRRSDRISRISVRGWGVYFAILTIAFAEFARIGFDHFGWVGGSAGFFLPVANYARNDLWNLRGNPTMFYYVMLALTAAAFALCHAVAQEQDRLLLAGHPRGRGGGALARHQHIPVQDDRGRHFRWHDRARRRVLRILLQQSLSRAGLSYLALDRDHSRPDHRRRSARRSARSSARFCSPEPRSSCRTC